MLISGAFVYLGPLALIVVMVLLARPVYMLLGNVAFSGAEVSVVALAIAALLTVCLGSIFFDKLLGLKEERVMSSLYFLVVLGILFTAIYFCAKIPMQVISAWLS